MSVLNINSLKKRAKSAHKKYIIITFLVSLVFTVMALFRAGISILNLIYFVGVIVVFFKNYSYLKRKTKVMYVVALSLLNLISVILGLLVVVVLIGSAGTDTFYEVLNTL